MTRRGHRRARAGMAVVAVMVLIALLFLTGTVMALAVSSSLRTIETTTRQDAIHYAAESAVARGVAAVVQSVPCPPSGSINKELLLTWCQDPPSPPHDGDQHGNNQRGDVQHAAIPGQRLEAGACTSISVTSGSDGTAWTVIAWRGAGDVRAWVDSSSGCSAGGGAECAQTSVFSNVRYVQCALQGGHWLHVAGRTGGVTLGSSVVRWAPADADPIRTVVGSSGFEVDEADVVIPADQGQSQSQNQSSPRQIFWNTVLP
jgi:hypothetical protein